MIEAGKVLDVRGGNAKIKMVRTEACQQCGRCGIFGPKGDIIIEARNDAGATAGDDVEVEMGTMNVLHAAILVYMFPLASAMVGFVLGSIIAKTAGAGDDYQGIGAISGFVLLGAAYLVLRRYDAAWRKSGKLGAVIVGIKRPGELEHELEQGGRTCDDT